MGFRLSAIARSQRLLGRSPSANVQRDNLAVYVGDNRKKRFIISVSYLNQPRFQDLLSQSEEEFGYNHPMGGLTIPCRQDIFLEVVSNCLNGL